MSPSRQDHGFTLLETLLAVAVIGVIAVIAVPATGNQLRYLRLSGDARKLSNALLLTKMRAAATFTQARLYVDLSAKSFRIETWNKTATTPDWVTEGGTTALSGSDVFGFASVGTPPPYSQVAIAQAPGCYTSAGALIGNTACIVFNSRGIPIAATGKPTGKELPIATNAVYVTDTTAVYGATVSATGMIRLWRTPAAAAATWKQQ